MEGGRLVAVEELDSVVEGRGDGAGKGSGHASVGLSPP